MDTLNKVTISTQTVKKDILNPFVIAYVNKESVARDEDQEVSVLTLNKENLAPIFYEKKDTEAFVLTESKESEPLTLTAQKKDESFSKEPNLTENNYDLPQGTSLIQNNNETASISAQNKVHNPSILTAIESELNDINHDKDKEAPSLPQINDHVTNILTQNEEKVAPILYENKDEAAFDLIVNKENEAPIVMAEIIDESLSSLTQKKHDEASNSTENNYDLPQNASLIRNDNETASISAQNNVHNASILTVTKSEVNDIDYDKDEEAPSLPQSGRNHVTKMYTQNEGEVLNKLPKKVEFNLTETEEENEPIIIQSNAIKRSTFVSHEIDFNDAPDTEVCNKENEKFQMQTRRSTSDSKLNINYYRCAVLMPTYVIQPQVIPLNKKENNSITNITMKPKNLCENLDKKYTWDLKEFLSLRSNQWAEWAAQKRNAMFKTPGHSECKKDVTDNNIETSVPDLSDQNIENENTLLLKPAVYDKTISNTNKDDEVDILNTDPVCMIPSKISSKSSINSEISNKSDNKTLLVSDIYNARIQKTVDCDDTCLPPFNESNEKLTFNKINKTPSLSVVLALTKVLPESSKVNTASNLPEKAAILPQNEDLTSLLSQNKSLNNSKSSQLITLNNAKPFTVPFDKENITLKLDSSKENAPNLKETAILIQSIENETPVPFEKDGEMASLNSFNNNKVASDLCFIKLDSKLKTIEQETRVWFQSKDEITASNEKIVSNVSQSEEPSKAKEELKPSADSIKMTQKVVNGKEMTHYGNNLTQGAFKLNVSHPAPIKSVINQLKVTKIKKLYKKSKGIIGFFTKPFKGSDGGSSHHR